MKAAVCTRYGPPDVLRLRDVDTPVPGARDILIRIHATAVSISDCYIRSAVPSARLALRVMLRLFVGLTKPRRSILGSVLAGEVVHVGRRVERFRVGDRVYAFTLLRCGCYAEYTRLPQASLVAAAPSNLTYDEAAALPYGGLIALHFLKTANIRPGQRVLVYGASGAIGTSALQLAKHSGADVTAVCGTANVELVRSLGADAVLDYTREHTPGTRRFDLVFDAAGRRKSSALKVACQSSLTPEGRNISVDDARPRARLADLVQLTQLAETGALKPVIDRRYPLEQIADAHRYVEQQHKKGNVIITVAPVPSRAPGP
jgi:NADPH:quinone reductase-like Zn-dependent oxidoreductase